MKNSDSAVIRTVLGAVIGYGIMLAFLTLVVFLVPYVLLQMVG